MVPICLCFAAHLPYRLRRYNYFDVGRRHDYLDAEGMASRLARAEALCYGPATDMLQRLLQRHPRFSFSLALSGPLLEQLRELSPGRLLAFRRLVESGRAEPLAATSHHCLPWPVSATELRAQMLLHRERVRRELGREPVIFGGEDPSDAAGLAALDASKGFSGMLLAGDPLPSGAARRRLYRVPSPRGLPAMVRDDRLSDDIARRFSGRGSGQGGLTAEKFDGWISATSGDILCLSMDLATFGLRHSRESGVFDFFEAWVGRTLAHADSRFLTPSQAFAQILAGETLPPAAAPVPTANELQQDARASLAALERRVAVCATAPVVEAFRRLTSSDHLAQMTLRARGSAAGGTGSFESPYEAYMAFRHAVRDLERRLPRRPERTLSAGPIPA